MISGSNLFIKNLDPIGDYRCYYCGTKCNNKNNIAQYVKDTFTNRDIVKFPGSEWVCDGCVVVCSNKLEFKLCTGEKVFSMPRNFSWVITKTENVAYSKGHIPELRGMIVNPPDPPFAIIIAISGQKQLLFRSVVSNTRDNFPILFEESETIININDLLDKIEQATNIAAVVGKMALTQPPTFNMAIQYYNFYGSLIVFNKWYDSYQNQISQIAAFLCDNKKNVLKKWKRSYMKKISMTELYEKITNISDDAATKTNFDVEVTINEAVMFIAEIPNFFSDDLDRITMWDRIGNGIGSAANKADGDFKLFVNCLVEYVKADYSKFACSKTMQNIISSFMLRDRNWQRFFVETCQKFSYLIVAMARISWNNKKTHFDIGTTDENV